MTVLDLPEAKKYLNVSGTENDAELAGIIAAAVSAIEQIVGPLELTDDLTAVVRACGYNALILPVLPVGELVSVTPYAGTALDLAGLQLDSQAGLITWAMGSSSGFAGPGYTVVYKAGRNPVPADLVLAVKEMVRHLWVTQRGSGVGRRPGATQAEALANTLPGAAYSLPIRVMQLLGPYTFVGFA